MVTKTLNDTQSNAENKYLYIHNGTFYYNANGVVYKVENVYDYKDVEGLGRTSVSIGILDVKIKDFKYYIVYWEHCYFGDHCITVFSAPCLTFEDAVYLAYKLDSIEYDEYKRFKRNDSSREYIFDLYKIKGMGKVNRALQEHFQEDEEMLRKLKL